MARLQLLIDKCLRYARRAKQNKPYSLRCHAILVNRDNQAISRESEAVHVEFVADGEGWAVNFVGPAVTLKANEDSAHTKLMFRNWIGREFAFIKTPAMQKGETVTLEPFVATDPKWPDLIY